MTQGLTGVAGVAAGAGGSGAGRPAAERPAQDGAPASAAPDLPRVVHDSAGEPPEVLGSEGAGEGATDRAPGSTGTPASTAPSLSSETARSSPSSGAPGADRGPLGGRRSARPAARATSQRGFPGVVAGWRTELASLGGPEPLMSPEDLRDGSLDLGAAHPSGGAMLLAGRPTRLSHLFREPGALEEARRRARAIRGEAAALADEHGLQACVLAVGLASWHDEATGAQVSTPLLLRPAELHARGSGPVDYEIGLGGPVRTNPALVRELERRGVPVDPAALAALSVHTHGFDPAPALERLRSLTRVSAPDVQVKPGLLVTVLVDVARSLVADLDRVSDRLASHDVVLALSGDAPARQRLQGPTATTSLPPGARGVDPDDVQVLPLDASQRRVLDAVLAGRSLRVEAGPGTGATQVAATAIAALAATGRSALLVAGQQQEAEDVARRLAARGLGDLVVDSSGSVDPNTTGPLPVVPVESPVVAGMVPSGTSASAQDDVVAALGRHRAALHLRRGPWGVSALQAMSALAVLPTGPDPVRLAPAALRAMDPAALEQAQGELREAVELGALAARAGDTAWSGAALGSRAEAAEALDEVRALRDDLLPALRRQATALAGGSGLRLPACVADAQAQLDLLTRVRDCLDSFLPAVFDRSLAPLVEATAPAGARSGARYGLFERRRQERAARELVRPGVLVSDLHGALAAAERTRVDWESWRAEDAAGSPPRVPQGVPAAEVVLGQVTQQVDALSAVLAPTSGGGALADEPWHALTERLGALVADSGALEDLPQRASLLAVLDRRGLVPLLEEARRRSLDPDQAVVELQRTWWRSVLDTLTASDPALAAAAASTAPGAHADAAAALAAHEKRLRAAAVHRVHGATALSASAPCVVTGPLALSHELASGRRYDVVLVLAAHRVGVPEAVLAASTGQQVVVIGDPGGPTPVRVAPRRSDEAPLPRGSRRSVFAALEGALPTVRLAWQHRMPLQLAALSRVVPGTTAGEHAVPCPPGRPPVRLRRVSDVTGRPDAQGVVESPDGEVAAVVDLVLQHVREHPHESLAVIALTRPHARRVADAIRAALPHRPELAAFLRRRRREGFVVTDVERCADTVRDAVVLSVGLGVSPLGRFVHRFGPLDDADGHRSLAAALTRARRRLTVVSCVAGEVLEPAKLTSTGAEALRALLLSLEEPPAADPLAALRAATPGSPTAAPAAAAATRAARRTAAGATTDAASTAAGEPLVERLAERLAARGARPLVTGSVPELVVLPASGDTPAVAVLTDLPTGVDDDPVGDLVQRELVVPEQLGHLGWRTVRVGARELFEDPAAAVAEVVRELSERG